MSRHTHKNTPSEHYPHQGPVSPELPQVPHSTPPALWLRPRAGVNTTAQRLRSSSSHTQVGWTEGPVAFTHTQTMDPADFQLATPQAFAGDSAHGEPSPGWLRPLAGLRAGPPGPLHSIGPAAGTGT